MKIDTTKLKQGDIISVRNPTSHYGMLIRCILGSYTNHNGLIIKRYERWYIGEAVPPRSKLTTITEYEESKYIIRIWRVDGLTDQERDAINQYFLDNCIGVKYPISVYRLWIYRFVNNLPWTIEGEWCSALVRKAIEAIVPRILDNPQHKTKINFTPRTFENRLVAGVIRDITDEVCIP